MRCKELASPRRKAESNEERKEKQKEFPSENLEKAGAGFFLCSSRSFLPLVLLRFDRDLVES